MLDLKAFPQISSLQAPSFSSRSTKPYIKTSLELKITKHGLRGELRFLGYGAGLEMNKRD